MEMFGLLIIHLKIYMDTDLFPVLHGKTAWTLWSVVCIKHCWHGYSHVVLHWCQIIPCAWI